ncbi:hypothetical protein [Nocardioides sp. zg-1228]|uniref:hypothetical protein n=1 Tax=Nocardioides sp. zg-1228 TaxID=2763008 RepID=UPI0016433A98|nr:hypothetical protein [Nocardioides sp. zg-1228]MBC2932346.1 hypothetical protein [Nocardioides sp. zg-1228]QSF57861.1 hypothetical protein JX575_01075 [Nocardioides sp. zg-1228]
MKPISGTVLVVAALLTSPALAGAATGAVPLDVALGRYLLVTGLCWVLLTMAAEWLWSEPQPAVGAEPPPAAAPPDATATEPDPERPRPR